MWWARRLGSGRHVVLRTRGRPPHDLCAAGGQIGWGRRRTGPSPPRRWANGREELTVDGQLCMHGSGSFHAILVLSQLCLHVKSKRLPRDIQVVLTGTVCT
jgi:hypothetical protein